MATYHYGFHKNLLKTLYKQMKQIIKIKSAIIGLKPLYVVKRSLLNEPSGQLSSNFLSLYVKGPFTSVLEIVKNR